MGNIINGFQYSHNEQLTRGNLTGLATTGNQLQEKGLFGKTHNVDTDSAYRDLASGRSVSVKTQDGRTLEIHSLAELQQYNQQVGMGAANRQHNAQASQYNHSTPPWWPKEGYTHVSPDGSHLDPNFCRFRPMQPAFGGGGGWSPFRGF